jgi:hypothetical protein
VVLSRTIPCDHLGRVVLPAAQVRHTANTDISRSHCNRRCRDRNVHVQTAVVGSRHGTHQNRGEVQLSLKKHTCCPARHRSSSQVCGDGEEAAFEEWYQSGFV